MAAMNFLIDLDKTNENLKMYGGNAYNRVYTCNQIR